MGRYAWLHWLSLLHRREDLLEDALLDAHGILLALLLQLLRGQPKHAYRLVLLFLLLNSLISLELQQRAYHWNLPICHGIIQQVAQMAQRKSLAS